VFDGQFGDRVKPSREEVLVDFRPADAAWANALDISGFAFAQVAVSFFPAQGLLLGLAVTGVAYVVSSPGGVVAGLALTVMLAFLERHLRRDFLTPTHIVREAGLVRRSRFTLALKDVEWVKVSPPRFGSTFDAANIEVRYHGGLLLLPGVAGAYEKAESIKAAVEAIRK
jgi:hypothetical protein